MKKSRISLHILLGVLAIGVGCIAIILFKQLHVRSQHTANSVQGTTNSARTKQPPTSVTITKLHRDLPIQAGIVEGNNWDLFENAVGWVSTSAVPGEGNVILYAHDWESLWGDLYTLQPGDMVEVYQNQKKNEYKVTESRSVDEHDVKAVMSDNNQLTMFTCEGTFDQKRRVVYAVPVNL